MPDQKPSILIGAAVSAVLSTSYLGILNCFCCAGVVIGSVVAIWHYTNRFDLTIEAGRGAVIGLIAAALGMLIALFLNFFLMKAGLGGQEVVYDFIMGFFAGVMDPDQMEMIEEQMEAQQEMQQNIGLGSYLVSGLLPLFVASLMGAVGGAIGAAIFKKGGAEPATEW